MSTSVDIVALFVGGTDSINSISKGSAGGGPAAAAGSVISTAANTAAIIGTIRNVSGVVIAATAVGGLGSALTGIQLTVDVADGREIQLGDVISVGVGLPVAIAVGVGALAATSIILPIATVAGIAAAILNLNNVSLSDVFDALSLNKHNRELSPTEKANTEQFLDEQFPYLDRRKPNHKDFIDVSCNSNWGIATTPPRRDPLAIDLDGDGIETVGIPVNGNPVLFDHDANGVKTGTGWVKSDDAWLVLDRDLNGIISSGRELFGVDTMISTPSSPGSTSTVMRNARSGFEALASLDTGNGTIGSLGYGDGIFNVNDAQFANVKIWQDSNQDGISQSSELFSLAAKGIATIGLTATALTTNLGNGNTVTGQAIVTRTNGTSTSVASVDMSASNLELANNPFYREFGDVVPVTESAAALPEMGGSGWVRDLREAMSLGNSSAGELTLLVNAFAKATTRDAQMSQIDMLLETWARTTGTLNTSGGAQALTTTVLAENSSTRTVRYTAGATVPGGTQSAAVIQLPNNYYDTDQSGAPLNWYSYNSQGLELLRRIGELEVFNGARFINFTATESVSGGGGQGSGGGGGSGGQASGSGLDVRFFIPLAAEQVTAVNAAYDALRGSVYQALVMQTRLRPYLDAVALVIDETGISFDAAPMSVLLETNKAANSRSATLDLVELTRFAGDTLQAVGFDGTAKLRAWVDALPVGSALRAELTALDVLAASATVGSTRADIYIGDVGANTFDAGAGNDILDGGSGNDSLGGRGGDDTLLGKGGDDSLSGDDGNDTLDGGAGADRTNGGLGNNVHLFGKGDGQDTIALSYDTTAGKLNTVQFKSGVAPGEVVASRDGVSLVLTIAGTTDKVTVEYFFYGDDPANVYNPVQQVKFADGTVWSLATIQAKLFAGTAAADGLTGTVGADAISGQAGADNLAGRGGNDTLSGGADNDNLSGEDGNDTLDGGTGVDTLTGGLGNNTYLFGKGDGQDSISGTTHDAAAGKLNTVQFKTGVLASEVVLKQVYDSVWGGTAALELSIAGTTDKLTIGGFTYGDNPASPYNPVQQVRFADGTVWDTVALQAMTATSFIAGTSAAETLAGTTSSDKLTGLAGNDTLNAGAGNDLLDGGTGSDSMLGGAGNDYYIADVATDIATELANEGNDTVRSLTSWTLGANLENLILGGTSALNGTGNGLNNWLYGNSGANTLNGAVGIDVAAGGGGNDTYVVDNAADSLVEGINEGTDYVSAGLSWTLGANLENLTLTGTTAINATGNELNNALVGNSAANVLTGAAGNDTLNGGAGADTLLGGTGNDAYTVDTTADIVTEALSEGTDTVSSSVAWTLGANFEYLTLTGSAVINGTGNELANTLTGNSAVNVLSGKEGNDIYSGGGGNDSLVDTSTTSGDTYRWGGGQGSDAITDAGGADRIELASGITSAQVTLTRSGNNLLLGLTNSTDKLTVVDHYVGAATRIEEIRLADGTVMPGGAMPTAVAASSSLTMTAVSTNANIQPVQRSGLLDNGAPTSGELIRGRWIGKRSVSTNPNLLLDAMAQFSPPRAAIQPMLDNRRAHVMPVTLAVSAV